MKKKILAMLLTLSLLFNVALPYGAYAADGGVQVQAATMQGAGTEDDPFVIKTEADLKEIANNKTSHFILANNITLTDWAKTNAANAFNGVLDGNGYTITHTAATAPFLINSTVNNGKAVIKNLRIVAGDVSTANQFSGMFCSTFSDATIENCAVIVKSIKGTNATTSLRATLAGMVDTLQKGAVMNNCFAAVSFDTTDWKPATNRVGALAAHIWDGTQSSFTGSVTNSYYNSDLYAKGIGAKSSGNNTKDESNPNFGDPSIGKTTAEMQSVDFVTTLNNNIKDRDDLLEWRYVGGEYPDFSSHKTIVTGEVKISGTAKVGETLTATDTFGDIAGKAYTWYRVSGESEAQTETQVGSGSTYELVEADKNCTVKVKITLPSVVGGTRTATSTTVKSNKTVQITFAEANGLSGVNIVAVNSAGVVDGAGVTGTDGKLELKLGAEDSYTYYAGKNGYADVKATFNTGVSNAEESLTMATVAQNGYSSTENYNMLVYTIDSTFKKFPTSLDTAMLKWYSPTGTAFGKGEPTNAVIAGGSLFVVGQNADEDTTVCLKKVDMATGEVLGKVALSNTTGYNFFLTTDGSNIYIMEGTRVEAFKAADLTSKWVSKALPGGQGLCPINYADGFVYGGTCAANDAGFFCLSAEDGTLIWFNQAKAATTPTYTGSYWAGGCVIGNYVVYGTGAGYIYSADKLTGQIVTETQLATKSDIRSSVVYDGAAVYFTSVDGKVHKAAFNSNGTLGEITSVQIGSESSECTATPVVNGGKLYVGTSAYVAVFNTADMSCVGSLKHSTKGEPYGILRDLRLVVNADNDEVYAFTTYYKTPGGVIVFKITNGGQTIEPMNLAGLMPAEIKQYCASMPIAGADGVIYASNDKGYLSAYAASTVLLNSLESDCGKLTATFDKMRAQNELVVPIGTTSVKLTFTTADEHNITVNNTVATPTKTESGTATYEYTAALEQDGTAQVNIKVSDSAADFTNYTVNIRPQHTDNAISVVTSASNDIEDGTKTISKLKGTDDVFVVEGATADTRIWLGAHDEMATLGLPIFTLGNSAYDNDVTISNVANDVEHTTLVYSGSTKLPLVTKMSVTAENGAAKQYYVLALSDKAYNGTDTYCLDMTATQQTIVGLGNTLDLSGYLRYVGKKPENCWTSSNEAVATVDKDGVVTAVSAGKAAITISYGSFKAVCNVTVSEKPVVYMSYSDSNGNFESGKDNTLLWNVPVEIDTNSAITVDDVFSAFHQQYYNGEASNPYTTETGAYGVSVTNFWGSGSYIGYLVNNDSLDSTGGYLGLSTNVNSGDSIAVYNYQDLGWSDMYSYFDNLMVTATAGTAKEFIANGHDLWYNTDKTPVNALVKVYDASGAEVSTLATKVGANGEFSVTFPSAGTYYVETRTNTSPQTYIVPNRCEVIVAAAATSGSSGGGGGAASTDISVKFRLIGATESAAGVDMASGVDDSEYVTWIATKTYTLPKGSTDRDLFEMALEKAGLDYSIESNGWLNSITAPASLGGYVLGNMDNGTWSGWMYTLNSTHLQATLGGNTLKNGDSFIVHYINDYRYEDKEWATGSQGNSSTWNRWLKAKDVDPTGSANGSTASGSNAAVSVDVKPVISANANGEAKANLTAAEVKVVVNEAKDAGANVVVVAPKISGDADKVTVAMPVASAKAIGRDAGADLLVQTDIADVTLSAEDLSKLNSNGSISISVENQDDGSVTVAVTANDRAVVLGGTKVTIAAENAGAGTVLVQVMADGTEEVIKKCVADESGVTALIEGGCTVKVVAADVAFADTAKHWGKDAAEFVAARGIFNGTAEKQFAPNDKMNRAMVATVLYRLQNEPAVSGKLTFKDSIDDWAKEAVIWAAAESIVSGDENGNYNGSAAVTRQELAAMLYRFAKASGLNSTASANLSTFSDGANVADWATDAIKWAVGSGLIKGDENGALNPNGTATRAEVATVVMRLIEMAVR